MLYEYKCQECSTEFEVDQKISEPPLKECPDCTGKVYRLISQSSFILNGSGWYRDGYSAGKK
jgi:putative FmdB family regulatory protein